MWRYSVKKVSELEGWQYNHYCRVRQARDSEWFKTVQICPVCRADVEDDKDTAGDGQVIGCVTVCDNCRLWDYQFWMESFRERVGVVVLFTMSGDTPQQRQVIVLRKDLLLAEAKRMMDDVAFLQMVEVPPPFLLDWMEENGKETLYPEACG